MLDILHMNPSFALASAVLVGMGFTAIALSIISRLRSRALRELDQGLFPRVFDKTFNVFDINVKSRRIIENHVGLAIFAAVCGSWPAVTFFVSKTFQIGGILSCIIVLLCAALLLIDETLELNKNAAILTKAVGGEKGLANGDMKVLKIVKSSLPRLSIYHLFLAFGFFAAAITIQEITDAFLFVTSWIVAVVFALNASLARVFPWGQPMPSLLLVAGLSGLAIVLLLKLGGETRKKLFGFPHLMSVDLEEHQLIQMRRHVRSAHNPFSREPSPIESEKFIEKETDKHTES